MLLEHWLEEEGLLQFCQRYLLAISPFMAAADIHAAEVEEDIVPFPENEKLKDPHRFAFICRQHEGEEFLGEVEDIEKGLITGRYCTECVTRTVIMSISRWTSS